MDRDPLDELSQLRSASANVRHQPDPVVVSALVASIRSIRKEAQALGIADAFLDRITDDLIVCFRKLDTLPRDDPFWEGTNRRPTENKLGSFSKEAIGRSPEDPLAYRMRAAVQVLVGNYFDPEIWMWLCSRERVDVSWPVYAGLIGVVGGYDTAPEVVRFLRQAGLCDEARTTLNDLMRSSHTWVGDWAKQVATGCDAAERRPGTSGGGT